MTSLNANPQFYSSRLQENLRDIPYTIFEHLLDKDSILRPKQREAIECAAHKMFDEHKRAIALIMPTGTGKTVILARMIAGLRQDESIGHKTKKILIVTDSEEGIKNTHNKLKEFADIDAGLYYNEKKETKGKQVIVTTYNSWQSSDFPVNSEEIDLVVLDEAHRGISDARQEVLKKHDNAIFLALTASPTYDEERDLLEHFELAYKMPVQEAVEYKLISNIRNIVLNSDVNIDLEELAKSNENFDKALEIETKKEAANRIGIKYLVHGLHPDTKQPVREIRGIGSCYDTDHAEFVANLLNEEYNKAYPDKPFKHGFAQFIAGDTPNRDDIIKWHQAGEIQYLIYADLLNQNYDDKKIGVVMNFRMTESLVLAIQRGGRATRLDQEDPGKIALIVDIFHKFKGKFKKQPLFYAHAIGSATLITKEVERLATERSFGFSKISLLRQEEAREEARAMSFDIVTEEESILGIFNDYIVSNDKRDDELSAFDISENWENFFSSKDEHKKLGETTIARYLNSLMPFQDQEGNYFNPQDKKAIPTIYYCAERVIRGINYRVIKIESVRSFLEDVALKDQKRKDELSSADIQKDWKIYFNDLAEDKALSDDTIRNSLNRLLPVTGHEGQYVDPEDKCETPTVYYGAERRGQGGKFRVLKIQSVSNFLDKVVLKDRKRKDELSAVDIDKNWASFFDGITEYKKVSNGLISSFLNGLILFKEQDGQYISPTDKNENPFVYYGAERIGNQGKMRVLKLESVPHFLDKVVLKDRKRKDELSAPDIVKNWKTLFEGDTEHKIVSHSTINKFLNNLTPFKGVEGQYFDPKDTSENPNIYYGAERREKGGCYRVLKLKSVPNFLENVVLKDQKRKDELSVLTMKKVFLAGGRTLKNILDNYVPDESDINCFVHSSRNFKESIQIVTRSERGKSFRCVNENSIDILAKQNHLEYRDPEIKKKYEALAKKSKPE